MAGFTFDFAIPDELMNVNLENALRCGCFEGTTAEQQILFVDEIVRVENEMGLHPLFTSGILAAYAFFTSDKGTEVHGETAEEFFRNAWPKAKRHFVEDLIMNVFGTMEE